MKQGIQIFACLVVWIWLPFATSCSKGRLSPQGEISGKQPRVQDGDGGIDPEIEVWLAARKEAPDAECNVPIRAPSLIELTKKTRPAGLESLDFYQGLMAYDPQDAEKLYDRFVLAKDLSADLELTTLPHDWSQRRSTESNLYLGDTHEASFYWLIQERRSAYENGLATRKEIHDLISTAAAKVKGASEHFRTYIEIRRDQWRVDDSSEVLPYATDGRLEAAANSAGLWARRSLVAFADELRFLDRHGVVRQARITAAKFRDSKKSNNGTCRSLYWLVQSFFSAHDDDWSLALTHVDLATRFAKSASNPRLADETRLELCYRLACRKNGARFLEPKTQSPDLLLWLAESSPSTRAKYIEEIFCDPGFHPTSRDLRCFSVILDPATSEILKSNSLILSRLLANAVSRDRHDWYALSAIQNLVRLYTPNLAPLLINDLEEAWARSAEQSTERFRHLVTCTGHARLTNVNMMISRTLAFLLSVENGANDDRAFDLYSRLLAFRELESRELKLTVSNARKERSGRELLNHLMRLANELSANFWKPSITEKQLTAVLNA